jgi:hypothetical protein
MLPLVILGGIMLFAASKFSFGKKWAGIEGGYRGFPYWCYYSGPNEVLPGLRRPDGSHMSMEESNTYRWRGHFKDHEGHGHYGAYGTTGKACEAMVKEMIADHIGD